MLEDLHVTISGFQTALDKFWKAYLSQPTPNEAYNLDYARAVYDEHGVVLTQVLNMRRHAWNIARCLNTDALKSLNAKEN